jgi:hypothetical protein
VYDGIAPGVPFWMGAVLFVVAGLLLARTRVPAQVGQMQSAQTS